MLCGAIRSVFRSLCEQKTWHKPRTKSLPLQVRLKQMFVCTLGKLSLAWLRMRHFQVPTSISCFLFLHRMLCGAIRTGFWSRCDQKFGVSHVAKATAKPKFVYLFGRSRAMAPGAFFSRINRWSVKLTVLCKIVVFSLAPSVGKVYRIFPVFGRSVIKIIECRPVERQNKDTLFETRRI
jgi:hypothetical protein